MLKSCLENTTPILYTTKNNAMKLQNLILISLFLLSIIFLAASCNKDESLPPKPELPPFTTKGLNTFGCYINGEPWVAEIPPLSEIIGLRRLEAFFHQVLVNPPRENYLGIRARKTNQDGSLNQKLILEMLNVQNEGTYNLTYSEDSYWDISFECSDLDYELDTTALHGVNLLKFDSIEIFGSKYKIAAGTFEFTAINNECNDTLRFTDGRFDAIITN